VVDDEPTIGDVACRYLQRAGYEARVARDGARALEMVAERRPNHDHRALARTPGFRAIPGLDSGAPLEIRGSACRTPHREDLRQPP
jgi:CheY-like chemotaxis protein